MSKCCTKSNNSFSDTLLCKFSSGYSLHKRDWRKSAFCILFVAGGNGSRQDQMEQGCEWSVNVF